MVTVKRVLIFLAILVTIPVVLEYSTIRIDSQMPTQIQAGTRYPFTITVGNADTLQYSFWSSLPDSEFVQRTNDFIIPLHNVTGVDGIFGTCEVVRRPSFGDWCRPDWVLGKWQLHIIAWKWYSRHKTEREVIISFVVVK